MRYLLEPAVLRLEWVQCTVMHKFIFMALLTLGGGCWVWLEKPTVIHLPTVLSTARYEHERLENFAFVNPAEPFQWALNADASGEVLSFGAVTGEVRNLGPDRRGVSI